jgi:hypothetical protein
LTNACDSDTYDFDNQEEKEMNTYEKPLPTFEDRNASSDEDGEFQDDGEEEEIDASYEYDKEHSNEDGELKNGATEATEDCIQGG